MGRRSAAHTRKGRAGKVIGTLLAVLVFAGLAGGAVYVLRDDIKAVLGMNQVEDYEGQGEGEVSFVISDGDIGGDIATNLKEAGIIKSRKAFLLAVEGQSDEPVFHPGTYTMRLKMSGEAALTALLDGENLNQREFTIPEGLRVQQVLSRLADTGLDLETLQKLNEDPQSFGLPDDATTLEGFLFPATYALDVSLDERGVLQAMVDRMMEELDKNGVDKKDRFETVILASIIQKEAKQENDFAKVSRVLQNRLDQGMKLELDSTVSYGVGGTTVTTTQEQRMDPDNTYSTYYYEGLPPGPISMPGAVAIDAALHPADGDWLYFVAVNLETGETVFSDTYAEHLVAVAQWQEWMAENPDWNGSDE